MTADPDVIAALEALREEAGCCLRCVLHESRTHVVFGEGDPAADLMFVGEAPGYHEDQQGRPFVGQAGKLLDQLLASIGLTRAQVYIANVLKCRPPNNRDPRPEEIDACRPYLWRQIELIKPRIVCTLGNFATKLLSGDPAGITRVHGRPKVVEIGAHRTFLYPIFHPAAALYTPATMSMLKDDILRLPELLTHDVSQQQDGGAAGTPAAKRPAWLPPQSAASPRPPAEEPPQGDLLSRPASAVQTQRADHPAPDEAPAAPGGPRAASGEILTTREGIPAAVSSGDGAEGDRGDDGGDDGGDRRHGDRAGRGESAGPATSEQLGLF